MKDTTQYIVRRSAGFRLDLEYTNFRWARRTARELAKSGGVVSIWFLDRAPAARGFYRERLVVCYLVNGYNETITLHPPEPFKNFADRSGILARTERRNPATLAQYGDFR